MLERIQVDLLWQHFAWIIDPVDLVTTTHTARASHPELEEVACFMLST